MNKKEIKNCWEYMQCGRETGGNKADQFGVCPATTRQEFNGINGGVNGGRFCWFITGTLCREKIQGTFTLKITKCVQCPFYLQVGKEEGRFLVLTGSYDEG